MKFGSISLIVLLMGVSQAQAERHHLVKPGQNLARIARKYHVPVSEIAAANGMNRNSLLREGQMLLVPARGEVYVREGQTLSRIARKYNVSIKDIARQNGIKPESTIRAGQRLLLPGFEAAAIQDRAEKRWGRPKQRGVVTLYRVWSKQKSRIRLVDRHGRVGKTAARRMQYLLRSRRSEKRKAPDRRLLQLLARVSDHFGGRTINIISGYREAIGRTKLTSRHVSGKAIDFRIRGVPTQVLADYCRKFDHVGVGFYPNSHFIHLDVRKQKAFWTDISKPGEPNQLIRKNVPQPPSPSETPQFSPDDQDSEPDAATTPL